MISLFIEILADFLSFSFDCDYGFDIVFADFVLEATLERVVLTSSSSSSGFFVSDSAFLVIDTFLSATQSEYFLNSVILEMFFLHPGALIPELPDYFYKFSAAFVFLSSLLMKKSILY